jgi:formate/nitrite transporter FocA (FNT family)
MIEHSWLEVAFRGITSGFLMAALVWLLPASESAQFHVIVAMTYLIGVSGSAHIVAGSVGAFLLLASGEVSAGPMLLHFLLPVLAGNIVGGTALFAMLSYAQVMKEI